MQHKYLVQNNCRWFFLFLNLTWQKPPSLTARLQKRPQFRGAGRGRAPAGCHDGTAASPDQLADEAQADAPVGPGNQNHLWAPRYAHFLKRRHWSEKVKSHSTSIFEDGWNIFSDIEPGFWHFLYIGKLSKQQAYKPYHAATLKFNLFSLHISLVFLFRRGSSLKLLDDRSLANFTRE